MKTTTFEMTVKSGQVREDGKKVGGRKARLKVSAGEALRLVEAVLDVGGAGKLGQMLFAYGLTAKAQEAVGYEIPGSVLVADSEEAKVHEWSEEDTENYITALVAFDALEGNRAGGPNLVELRGFFRAMFSVKMDFDTSWEAAKGQKVKNSEDEDTARKVWEKVEAGL